MFRPRNHSVTYVIRNHQHNDNRVSTKITGVLLKVVFERQTMDNLQNIIHVFLKYATVRIL